MYRTRGGSRRLQNGIRARYGRPAAFAGLVMVLGFLLGGCAGGEDGGEVTVLGVGAPLESPVWAPEREVVFALRQADQSLAKVDVTPGGISHGGNLVGVAIAEELEGAGENFASDLLESGYLYVPQPELGQVTIIEGDDMLHVESFEAGPSPSRVTLDGPATELSGAGDTLFALSADGSTVTGVALDSQRRVLQREIDLGTGVLLESAAGQGREFWAAGSEGVVFHEDASPAGSAELSLDAGALAADPDNAGRAYIGESSSGRLLAVEAGPAQSPRITEEAELGEDVEQLAAYSERLYAATAGSLLVLDAQSLDTIATAEFGARLQERVSGRAVPSGMTVGEDSVYLTLEGEPYVVKISRW